MTWEQVGPWLVGGVAVLTSLTTLYFVFRTKKLGLLKDEYDLDRQVQRDHDTDDAVNYRAALEEYKTLLSEAKQSYSADIAAVRRSHAEDMKNVRRELQQLRVDHADCRETAARQEENIKNQDRIIDHQNRVIEGLQATVTRLEGLVDDGR